MAVGFNCLVLLGRMINAVATATRDLWHWGRIHAGLKSLTSSSSPARICDFIQTFPLGPNHCRSNKSDPKVVLSTKLREAHAAQYTYRQCNEDVVQTPRYRGT